MKNYIVQELDILNKVADVYIGDHLVGSWPYREGHPYWSVFSQIKNKSTPIHITEYDKIPSIGMVYKNGIFIDGDNGETFVDTKTCMPNGPLLENSHEAIVTVSESNKVDGCLIVFMKYKNWVNEIYAGLFAALTSSPTIIIMDNVDNKHEYLNNPELIGTIRKIPEFSDFQNFYSQWEGQ